MRRAMNPLRRLAIALTASAALLACGGSSTSPSDPASPGAEIEALEAIPSAISETVEDGTSQMIPESVPETVPQTSDESPTASAESADTQAEEVPAKPHLDNPLTDPGRTRPTTDPVESPDHQALPRPE